MDWLCEVKERGYAIWPDAFDAAAVRRDVLDVFGADDDAGVFALASHDWPAYLARAAAAQHAAGLYELCGHLSPRLRRPGYLPTLAMRPVLHLSAEPLASHHFYWKSRPHQDWASLRGSVDGLVLWAAVQVDETLGYLEVVPGSHRLGALRHRQNGPTYELSDPLEGYVPVPVRAGDVLVFSMLTAHRSGENRGAGIRMAVSYRFNNAADPAYRRRNLFQAFDYRRRDGDDGYVASVDDVRHWAGA